MTVMKNLMKVSKYLGSSGKSFLSKFNATKFLISITLNIKYILNILKVFLANLILYYKCPNPF